MVHVAKRSSEKELNLTSKITGDLGKDRFRTLERKLECSGGLENQQERKT